MHYDNEYWDDLAETAGQNTSRGKKLTGKAARLHSRALFSGQRALASWRPQDKNISDPLVLSIAFDESDDSSSNLSTAFYKIKKSNFSHSYKYILPDIPDIYGSSAFTSAFHRENK